MKDFDYLGMGNKSWPVKYALDLLPQNCGLGVLHYTFGGEKKLRKRIKKYLASGKIKRLRAHVYWNSHVGLCPKNKLNSVCKFYESLQAQYPGVKFYVSPTLEHYSKAKKKLKKQAAIVRSYGLIAVNNPSGPGVTIPGVINEKHHWGKHPGKYGISMDGLDPRLSQAKMKKWLKEAKQNGAVYAFGWIPPYNMRHDKPKSNPPPKQRKRKPTKAEIIKMRQV